MAAGHWWYDLVNAGTTGTRHVQLFQGDAEKWDTWATIRKANPLVAISADFRRKLLEERNEARGDTRLKARFLSYRLNLPSADESTLLLDVVADWGPMTQRVLLPRMGQPIDLGGGRAWSAAVAVWASGRIECLALAPGVPDIAAQEKRDRVPAGTYQRLADSGQLRVAEGLKVQPPGQLWDAICEAWGMPVLVLCDRFRVAELEDAIDGATLVEPRVTRWSEASADIQATRKGFMDGPFTVDEGSRSLLMFSLARAMVKTDDAGNARLVKRSTGNDNRDDVAAAFTLCCGAWERSPKPDEAENLVRVPILV